MSFLGKIIVNIISHFFSKLLVLSVVLLIFNQDIYAKNPQNESNNSCLKEIEIYESKYNIPKGLLRAISHIESGHKPYALNYGNGSYIFNNKQDLVEKAHGLINRGHYNLDIGCMQINYKWHSKYFNSIEEMVDIRSNVRYAAGFLYSLYTEYGSWQKAVRFYHSKNADYYKKYSRKVIIAWLYNR